MKKAYEPCGKCQGSGNVSELKWNEELKGNDLTGFSVICDWCEGSGASPKILFLIEN